jgi:hypothetical protein
MRFRRDKKKRQLGNASKRMDSVHASRNPGHRYRTQIQVCRRRLKLLRDDIRAILYYYYNVIYYNQSFFI